MIAAIGAGKDAGARELVAKEVRGVERWIIRFIGSHSVASAPIFVVASENRFYLEIAGGTDQGGR